MFVEQFDPLALHLILCVCVCVCVFVIGINQSTSTNITDNTLINGTLSESLKPKVHFPLIDININYNLN